MIKMNLTEIATAVNGIIKNDKATDFLGDVVIDSRKVKKGDLFFAINGQNFDGKDYAIKAIENGAVAVVCETEIPNVACIVVKDGKMNSKDVDQPAVVALGKLANSILTKLPKLWKIAVTGSSGKTTTKDLLSQLGPLVGPTVSPAGSFNNEIGMPLTILQCTEATRVLILEMGARRVGNIAHLCQIAKPDLSLILNIGKAHLEIFESEKDIFTAKTEIIKNLNSEDTAILNADDKTFEAQKKSTQAKVYSFGVENSADIFASEVEIDSYAKASFVLNYQGRKEKVKLNLLGEHQVSNALAAAAPFLIKGFAIQEVAKILSSSEIKSNLRMQVQKTLNNITILNDSYNANPESMSAAIRTLEQIKINEKKIAIIGEMRELGNYSIQAHEEIGKLISETRIDDVVVIGKGAKPIYTELLNQENWVGKVCFFENIESFQVEMQNIIVSNSYILIKASRSIGLERVADEILKAFGENLDSHENLEVGP